jgi:hypothetical protein
MDFLLVKLWCMDGTEAVPPEKDDTGKALFCCNGGSGSVRTGNKRAEGNAMMDSADHYSVRFLRAACFFRNARISARRTSYYSMLNRFSMNFEKLQITIISDIRRRHGEGATITTIGRLKR